MNRAALPAFAAALLALTAACGGSDTDAADLQTADTPAPPAASAAAPADAPPAAPVAEGRVEVAQLRVGEVDAAGEHDAGSCARYFLPAAQQGVVYGFSHAGLSVTIMTDAVRRPGVQSDDDVSIFVNGGPEPLAAGRGAGTVRFSDDFRTAEVDVMLATVTEVMTQRPGSVPFRATFRCR